MFLAASEFECVIDLKWIPSADNLADPRTSVPVLEDLRLNRKLFLMLWRRWAFLDGFGGASRSSSNAYLTPAGVSLPFLSQHFVQGCEMVDVIL